MKLADQIFTVLPPSQWHTAIDLPFPPAWHSIACKLSSGDVEELTWQRNFAIVADYLSSRSSGKLNVYYSEGGPNQLSITCAAHIDIAALLATAKSRARVWHCGCCATLYYNP